jgi:DNA modification methylase
MNPKPLVSRKKAIKQLTRSRSQSGSNSIRGLQNRIVWRPRVSLRKFFGNPRRHPEAQIARLMKNIKQVWTNPILVDETGTILAGHARCEAAERLGMSDVPTITIAGLNESEKRALVIADNRLPEQAVWDFDLLRTHFQELISVDYEVELTGFSTGEIDLLLDGTPSPDSADPADALTGIVSGPAVSRSGDIWQLERHRLTCGNALSEDSHMKLLEGDRAQAVITDAPYNVRIQGHAMGRGAVQHREFTMASGEMSTADFTAFLTASIHRMISFSSDGSLHYLFMDWRHLPELLAAALPNYTDWKNLLVWNKTNAGQGSFYRSKHELIAVFKKGTAPHINNFGLGAKGRYRTNVLDYPGVNSLHPARRGDLELHPTTKPVALVADLMRDCSRRNGIILDPFGGSGTTILAAERTGRIARLIELDPLYVDTAIRRWEKITGIPARLGTSGLSFEQVAAERGVGPRE